MKISKRFLSVLFFASSLPQLAVAAEQQVAKIEAIVNQEVILSSDISLMKRDLIARYQESGQALPDAENIDKQILDKLISDKLQLQIAERIGMRISDAQLDQTIEEVAKKQNKSRAQMQAEIEASGLNYNAYVDSIRDELTINEIRQMQVRRRINITDQEVEQMITRINEQGQQITEFNFAHIMLKVQANMPIDTKLETEKKADTLYQKLQAGADINALALKHSDGPKALEGGNWGWRKMDSMPSLFAENIAVNNKKGDIIGPFESEMGVHIIKILDKKGAENVLTEEVNARHILVKPNIILSDQKAKEMLAMFRQQIIDGSKTFEELAKEHSQDPGSAVKGGELGWADPNMYVPEFRDLSLSQPIDEISQPFHTMHGWHILQVIAKRQSDTTEEATKQKAYTLLFRQRFPAEVYAWLNEIRQEAYIKITNPDYIIEEE